MALGAPKTTKATIGSFELRVGPLTKSGQLTSAHSVGIIDQVKLDVQLDSVDLLTGFPQKPADTAITRYVSGLTATLRETSLRNLNVLLGNDLDDTLITGKMQSAVVVDTYSNQAMTVAGSTSFKLTPVSSEALLDSGETFALGDKIVIYSVDDKRKFTVATVASYTPDATNDAPGTPAGSLVGRATINLNALTPLLETFDQNENVKVAKVRTLSGGNADGTPKYFGAQIVRLDRSSGVPIGFDFWKTTLAAGLSFSSNVTDFASFELQLKALEPSAIDYASGGDLYHLREIIPTNPVFRVFDVPDV